MSGAVVLVGGLISAFALGWGLGRTVKAVRQFFDVI